MGDSNCRVGAVCFRSLILDKGLEARKCAEDLTKETGEKHEAREISENISDGLPARVMQMYYEIVKTGK